jgi:transposase
LVAAEVLAKFRALVARGASLRSAAAELKRPRSTLYDLARRAKLPLKRRGLSRDQRAELTRALNRGLSERQASQRTGISRSTIWRHKLYFARLRDVQARASEPRPCTPWRCPRCGALLKLTICVADGARRPPKRAKPRS